MLRSALLLFESRAKGTAHPDSDWDLYVIINEDLPHQSDGTLQTAFADDTC